MINKPHRLLYAALLFGNKTGLFELPVYKNRGCEKTVIKKEEDMYSRKGDKSSFLSYN